MTPKQMQEKSSMKVKQVLDLMAVLNLTVEAKERVNNDGFIEKLVFWIDNEKYPAAEVPAGPMGIDAPTGETGAGGKGDDKATA